MCRPSHRIDQRFVEVRRSSRHDRRSTIALTVRRPRATAAVIVSRDVPRDRACGATADAGHFFLRDRCDQAKSGAADHKPRAGQAAGSLMLAAYVPNGHSLERRDIVSGEEIPENAVWLDLVNPAPGEDKVVERLRRDRRADPRGDAGDRGLEPALRRASRPLHDRDADVQFRHRDAEDHRGDLHPLRPSPRHGAL